MDTDGHGYQGLAEQASFTQRVNKKIRLEIRVHLCPSVVNEFVVPLQLRNLGLKVAVFALVMLTICLALSSLFTSDLTEGMRPLVRTTFEYGFEIIGWVILWHPIDVLVFSPVAIRARLAALQTLATVDIVILAEPMPASVACP